MPFSDYRKTFDNFYERRAVKIIADMLEDVARLTNHPMRVMNTPFIPSTDKQKNMLAHQIKRSHDGPYEHCLLDRAQLEEFKRLNEAGKIDKFNTSDLISVLDRYNEAIYLKTDEEAAPFADACKRTLNILMTRIKGTV